MAEWRPRRCGSRGVEPHAGEECADAEQESGGGEGGAFAEVEERAIAVEAGEEPGEVRGGGGEGVDRAEGEAAGQESREGQAEAAIPGDHRQRGKGEARDGDHPLLDPGLASKREGEDHDADAEGGGEHHRRQGHSALEGEIARPPPGDACSGEGDEGEQSEATERGEQAGDAGQEDDEADRDEYLGETTKNSNG